MEEAKVKVERTQFQKVCSEYTPIVKENAVNMAMKKGGVSMFIMVTAHKKKLRRLMNT